MGSTPLGIGLMGYGQWGPNYARIISEFTDARLTAICDISPPQLTAAAARFPGAFCTRNAGKLLSHPEVKAVIIATPAATHAELAATALTMGRDVLVEKPLALNSADGERLCELARRLNRILMTGHTFLFNGGVRELKRACAPEHLGRLYYLYSIRTNLGPIRSDTSALWDLASHDVAIFDYLMDAAPRWVSAVGSRVLSGNREDVVFVTLSYLDNVVANIRAGWIEPHKVRETVVVGAQRRVVFNDLNPVEPLRIYQKGIALDDDPSADFGGARFAVRDGDIHSPKVDAIEPLSAECRHFIDCVGSRQQPQSDGACGLRVIRVLEAVEASFSGNGKPVSIEDAGSW